MGTRTQEKAQDQKYKYEMIGLEVIILTPRVIEFGERDKERERNSMSRNQGLKYEVFNL